MSFFRSINSYKGTAFEVIVIVFGVMLSFLLNEIRIDLDDKDETISTLIQIKADLEKDLEDTEINIDTETSAFISCKYILKSLNSRNEYNKELNKEFDKLNYYSILLPSTTGLNILNSNGVNCITNDSLRVKFLQLHNYWYKQRAMVAEKYTPLLNNINNYLYRNFNRTEIMYDNDELQPNDYNNLLDDSYFISLVNASRTQHDYLFYCDSLIKAGILEILPLIDEEIGKLK